MTREEFENVIGHVHLIGSLVRGLPLGDVIRACERADAVGPLLSPSHWIAGRDKNDLNLKLAKALQAFQSALPTAEEADKLDREAAARMERLGITP